MEKAYEVSALITIKAYLDDNEVYDNHTADKILSMIAADIMEGWITRSEVNVSYKEIHEISWEDIDDYNPWERAKEDAAIE